MSGAATVRAFKAHLDALIMAQCDPAVRVTDARGRDVLGIYQGMRGNNKTYIFLAVYVYVTVHAKTRQKSAKSIFSKHRQKSKQQVPCNSDFFHGEGPRST